MPNLSQCKRICKIPWPPRKKGWLEWQNREVLPCCRICKTVKTLSYRIWFTWLNKHVRATSIWSNNDAWQQNYSGVNPLNSAVLFMYDKCIPPNAFRYVHQPIFLFSNLLNVGKGMVMSHLPHVAFVKAPWEGVCNGNHAEKDVLRNCELLKGFVQ